MDTKLMRSKNYIPNRKFDRNSANTDKVLNPVIKILNIGSTSIETSTVRNCSSEMNSDFILFGTIHEAWTLLAIL